MIRSYLVLVAIAILSLFSQSVLADGYDDCKVECDKKYSDCITLANKYVNDIEIQDAKEVCDKTGPDCNNECVQIEVNHGFDKTAPKKSKDEPVK